MHKHFVVLILLTLSIEAAAGHSKPSDFSQLTQGSLDNRVYTNDSVGITYEIPAGWQGTVAVDESPKIDWRDDKKPANRCSRVLLRLEPREKAPGRFNSNAVLLAIDPACLGIFNFPASESSPEVVKLAKRFGDTFNYTSYMSPFGNQVRTSSAQGHVLVHMEGSLIINAIEGHHAPRKEPLKVYTSFTVTNARGFLLAIAYLADDPGASMLKTAALNFKDSALAR